ncbi:hypothetical protein [Luteimonas huabeiensis]|uniref:hypothetical protein n=1 Tax=Luteimonas huabeiensis TaxID=1244513 RepID=UPI000466EC2B|nr:hypothetical protein [Luteimonas huabeiensis]
MTQAIDPIKLKAAAERLAWVLKQYPRSDEVQGLLRALWPLLEDARAGRVREPLDGESIPGACNFGDGVYAPYKHPDVDEAYAAFYREIGGREARLPARARTRASGR